MHLLYLDACLWIMFLARLCQLTSSILVHWQCLPTSALSFVTAGQPKGVKLTHASLTSGVAGHLKRSPVMHNEYDIYIGYLPLAHVFELIAELCALTVGTRVSSSEPTYNPCHFFDSAVKMQ